MPHSFTSVADMPRRYRADHALERAYRRAEVTDHYHHVGNLPMGRNTTLDRSEAVDMLLAAGLLEADDDRTILNRVVATQSGYRVDPAVRLPRQRVAQMLAEENLLETWLTRRHVRDSFADRVPGWRQIVLAHLSADNAATPSSRPLPNRPAVPAADPVDAIAAVLALSVDPRTLFGPGACLYPQVRVAAAALLCSAQADGRGPAAVITVLSRIDNFAGTVPDLAAVAAAILAN